VNQEQVLREFNALPPIAQQEARDFIAFLRSKYLRKTTEKVQSLPDVIDEPFVGMWRDRSEMTNSSNWGRNVRTKEWG
jgi:hypothetical protein